MHLYLIRHAETVANVQRKLQGWHESPLTDKGLSQVEQLVKRLRILMKREGFKAVYSSPTGRALQTAERSSEGLGLPLEVDELLLEMNHGAWDGLTVSDIEREYPELWAIWRKSPHMAWFPNGESLLGVMDRARRFLYRLLERHPLDSVIVVSHAGIIKLMVLFLLQIPLERYWLFGIENASITALRVSGSEGRVSAQIIKLNDTGHLDMAFEEPQLNTVSYLSIPDPRP